MQTQSTSDDWQTFNALAERTLQEAPLPKDELTKLFIRIEKLIYSGIGYLLNTTTFTEDNLCYLLAEIASGVIKSRKVYKGRRIRRRIPLTEEIEMGSENKRIFGIGFDLFKLSRMSREEAAPLVKRIIRTLRVSTSTYESMLLTFAKEGQRYRDLSDELTEVTLDLLEQRRKNSKRATKGSLAKEESLTLEASRMIDELEIVEMNVGCVERNFLYGTIRAIDLIVREIRRLQERILRAYSRLILKPVRDRAQGEMEALDLFQSGSLGLARAISLYDVRSGTSFPTFATWWIRQKIFGSIKFRGPLIKLPGSVLEKYQQIRAAERHFSSDPEKHSSYTVEDIAAYCKTSVKSVELVRKKVQSTQVISLDSMVYDNEEGFENESATDRALLDDSLEEEEEFAARQDFVESVLDHLEPDQRNLVCLRYGVIDSVKVELSPRQVLRETFRQAACRAILQRSMAVTADERLSLLRPEELPPE